MALLGTVNYAPHAARFIRQHWFDSGPFIIAEFVAHVRGSSFGVESGPRRYHQAAMDHRGAANTLNELPLSATRWVWSGLVVGSTRSRMAHTGSGLIDEYHRETIYFGTPTVRD